MGKYNFTTSRKWALSFARVFSFTVLQAFSAYTMEKGPELTDREGIEKPSLCTPQLIWENLDDAIVSRILSKGIDLQNFKGVSRKSYWQALVTAAHTGDPQAQYHLGLRLHHSLDKEEQENGKLWLQRAVESGHSQPLSSTLDDGFSKLKLERNSAITTREKEDFYSQVCKNKEVAFSIFFDTFLEELQGSDDINHTIITLLEAQPRYVSKEIFANMQEKRQAALFTVAGKETYLKSLAPAPVLEFFDIPNEIIIHILNLLENPPALSTNSFSIKKKDAEKVKDLALVRSVSKQFNELSTKVFLNACFPGRKWESYGKSINQHDIDIISGLPFQTIVFSNFIGNLFFQTFHISKREGDRITVINNKLDLIGLFNRRVKNFSFIHSNKNVRAQIDYES
ncbi:hypothetical protein [Candidatus Odyssella acanthamoebae]|uniref:F-box domain-containing protein n=1 Tax=Candidatus Odyssella acanthamoebae TaxID=91604 RepID=A0A077AW76_9PROT|nr:hypothetical protein [Candidatus Paracaedibacter acanthamoebae]AIK96304.1 hypothetical protein ID47_05480 [Candidatus Paracaedibacter acanthamoebae]